MARRRKLVDNTPDDPTPVSMNPFAGKKGFFNRLNRVVYTFTVPAQVGIGRPEAPYVAAADPTCPICGQLMALHTVDRSAERTRLHCPPRAA